MKVFSVILCFYVLLLSCLPCGDTKECNEPVKADVTRTNHTDHEDTESCSPFCVCACCGTQMAFDFQYEVKISENNLFLSAHRIASLYRNAFISGFYGNIWQPPRV